MLNKKLIHIEGIGNILLTRKSNAKKVIIRTYSEEPQVRVTIPYSGDEKKVINFIKQNKEWINKSKKRFKNNRKISFGINKYNSYYNLEVKRGNIGKNIIETIINQDDFSGIIIIDNSIDIENEHFINMFYKIRDQILFNSAKIILPPIVLEYSNKFNIPIESVRISNAHTLWGSCKGKKISVNKVLLLLPDNLIIHIILHELTHVIHANHSKAFYDMLKQLDKDSDKNSKELKKWASLLA